MLDFILGLLGFKKGYTQKAMIFCEDDTVRDVEIPIYDGYARHDEERKAYFNPRSMRMPVEGEEGLVLVVSERSMIPLHPYIDIPDLGKDARIDTVPIARQQYYKAREEAGKEAKRHTLASALYFGVIAFVLCFVILIIVGMVT